CDRRKRKSAESIMSSGTEKSGKEVIRKEDPDTDEGRNPESQRQPPVSAIKTTEHRSKLLLTQLESQELGYTSEPIPDPRFGGDVFGVIGIDLQFLPQISHEYPKVLNLLAIIRPPNRLQQLTVRDCFVCM